MVYKVNNSLWTSWMWFRGTQVLTIATAHAARTAIVDLNAYFPACQSTLNAATEQQQVSQRLIADSLLMNLLITLLFIKVT